MIALRACVAIAGLASSAAALPGAQGKTHSVTQTKGFNLPVYQDVRIEPLHKLRRKRQVENTNARIINMTSTSYLIELELGTPAQTVKVALDTGSSELWVNPNCQKAGNINQERVCNEHGHYRPAQSDTSRVSGTESRIRYGKGEVRLRYVADHISVPDTDINLENVIFGYGLDSLDLSMGIMGLSFGNEVNMAYPSVIDELYQQNVTKARAFGVALGTKDEPTGSGVISFGGVDTKKFSGELHSMPILGPQNGERLHRYWVQLDSVGLSLSGNSNKQTYSNSSFPVFFDTGATLSYLPQSLVNDLGNDLGGQLDTSVNLYIVPCGQKGSVDFTFGDKTIQVPLEEFIWNVGDDTCVLGADSTNDGGYILGDSFLRSVYTVFDMETPALHFSQYVNCGSNLQLLPSGPFSTSKHRGECSSTSSSNNGDDDDGDGDGDSNGSSGGSNGGGNGNGNGNNNGGGGGNGSGGGSGDDDGDDGPEPDSNNRGRPNGENGENAADALATQRSTWLAVAALLAWQMAGFLP